MKRVLEIIVVFFILPYLLFVFFKDLKKWERSNS